MKNLLIAFSLVFSVASSAETLEEVYLTSQDSMRFFKRLKSLSFPVTASLSKIAFVSKNQAFKFNCDASIVGTNITQAACVAVFDKSLSSANGTQISAGKLPNILYARFRDAADNIKLSAIRSGTAPGMETREERTLAYKPEPYPFPRFAINCDKISETSSDCYALSVIDCNTQACGKN